MPKKYLDKSLPVISFFKVKISKSIVLSQFMVRPHINLALNIFAIQIRLDLVI